MADTGVRADAAAAERAGGARYTEPTGWVGWTVFAAAMMILAGTLQAIYGLVAIVNDEWVVWGNRADLYLDLTAWGWVHLVVGALVVLAGFGLFSGNVVARTVGVVLAAASFVAHFLSLPAYPLWSLTVMALAVVVIWALTAHGHEMKALSRQPEIDLRADG